MIKPHWTWMISSLRVISGALWRRSSFFTPSQGPHRASCFQAKFYRISGTRITYMKLAKGPQGKLRNTREMLQIHVFGIRLREILFCVRFYFLIRVKEILGRSFLWDFCPRHVCGTCWTSSGTQPSSSILDLGLTAKLVMEGRHKPFCVRLQRDQ